MKNKIKPALLGGIPSVKSDPGDMFTWPIIGKEDEEAVLEVLRRGGMSGLDVTMEFEKDFARWIGREFVLGTSTGTGALQSAMYGCRIGVGDEIIGPSVTYWASLLPAFSLGATIVFCEINPDTLCLDPEDIEHRITERTKAILVVHYMGHPADMDRIMEIAGKHGIKVIEDVSHAHGGLYKGRKVGTFGEVAAMSLMSGKSLPIGEAGILVTDDRDIYERSVAWGHYSRFSDNIQSPELSPYRHMPLGGYKYRMHQLSSALGRVQLKHYDERMKEIDRAMNHFWDCLEGVPGIQTHRPSKDSGCTMGGWYAARGIYKPEELEGLSITRFCEAVRAEGVSQCHPGANNPLHLHPVFNTCDIYGHGKPTRIAHTDRDLRQPPGSLPVSEGIGKRLYSIPWFKHFRPGIIEEYAAGFRKAAGNYTALLEGDTGDTEDVGAWGLSGPVR